MADEFDRFLSSALAPEEREADRAFVARVQAAVALDAAFHAERRAALRTAAIQTVALFAVAAGLVLLGRAAPVADFFAESPAVVLAALLSGFGLLVILFGSQSSHTSAGQMFSASHFNDLARLRS
ncbi:MAG TPA: hypothetical protein VF757_01910 [Sphingomicrobium sp.]